jgi:hypothetical protein
MDGATSESEEGSSTQWNGIGRKETGNEGRGDEMKVKAPPCAGALYLYTSESEKQSESELVWSARCLTA